MTLDIKQMIAGLVTAGILSSLGFVFNNIDNLKTENAEQKAIISLIQKDLEEAEDDIDTLVQCTMTSFGSWEENANGLLWQWLLWWQINVEENKREYWFSCYSHSPNGFSWCRNPISHCCR